MRFQNTVRNWDFFQPAAAIGLATPGIGGGDVNPFKLLKRRGSLVVADLPISPVLAKMPSEMKSGGHLQQPPVTVFEEPDANSLLDSFGF